MLEDESVADDPQKRLPDVAPVGLPNFKPQSDFLVDLTSPQKPTIPAAATTTTNGRSEYDNLENAFSSPEKALLLAPPRSHRSLVHKRGQGWRPRDPRKSSRSRNRTGGRKNYQRLPATMFNADIVNEARRISQRFQALGWQSAISIEAVSSPSPENSKARFWGQSNLAG